MYDFIIKYSKEFFQGCDRRLIYLNMRKNFKCAQLWAKPNGITVEVAVQQDFLLLF